MNKHHSISVRVMPATNAIDMCIYMISIFCVVCCPIPSDYAQAVIAADTITPESEIGIQWVEVSYVTHGVSISSSGKATISSRVNAYSSGPKIYMNAELQKLSGSTFAYYDDYDAQGTGRAVVSKTQYVQKTIADIYDKSSRYLESVEV